MKKIFAILFAASAVTLAQAQGTIDINNGSAAFLISTNNGSAGSGLASGNVGKTVTSPAGSYDYVLLVQAYTATTPSASPLSGAWTPTITGANFAAAAGGVLGQGGATGAATPSGSWGAPTGGSASTSAEDYYELVGWSSNLGTTWSTVSGELNNNWQGFTTGQGVFGESAIGYGYSGGGSFSVNAPSIWGVSANEPGGLASGFVLNGISPIPEPTTLALAGLGGLSLLAFRRKKA